MCVWGNSDTLVRDVVRARVLADYHQGRGHWALDINLLDGSEGVPRVVVLEQNNGLIQEQSRK